MPGAIRIMVTLHTDPGVKYLCTWPTTGTTTAAASSPVNKVFCTVLMLSSCSLWRDSVVDVRVVLVAVGGGPDATADVIGTRASGSRDRGVALGLEGYAVELAARPRARDLSRASGPWFAVVDPDGRDSGPALVEILRWPKY